MKNLVAEGGFKITEFVSNSEKVVKTLQENCISSDVKSKALTSGMDRALGLTWMITSDELLFQNK